MPVWAKPAILQHLYRTEFDAGALSFKKLLVEAVGRALELNSDDAEAYAEANTNACWNYVFKYEGTNRKRGLSAIFSALNVSDKLLEWCPQEGQGKRSDPRKHALLKHRPAMLRALDILSEREYEMVGCVASELIGATHVHLTPRGKEGGVDFFALIVTPSPCHVFLGHNGTAPDCWPEQEVHQACRSRQSKGLHLDPCGHLRSVSQGRAVRP
jgi:hypothetical protein